jgi:signal peptidase
MTLDVRRLLKYGVAAVVLGIWIVLLRPQALGGGAMYIVVRGSSMQPTYQTGDLVFVESASAYAVNDIVAYRVPSGEVGEGHVIVHRIVQGAATSGFVVQGDNNDAPDPWSPRIGDVAGKAWFVVPGLGSLIAFVHQPVIAGGLAAGIMVSLILARPSGAGRRPRAPAEGTRSRRVRPAPARRAGRGP